MKTAKKIQPKAKDEFKAFKYKDQPFDSDAFKDVERWSKGVGDRFTDHSERLHDIEAHLHDLPVISPAKLVARESTSAGNYLLEERLAKLEGQTRAAGDSHAPVAGPQKQYVAWVAIVLSVISILLHFMQR